MDLLLIVQDYILLGKALLQQLKRPNIACHSLWSSHPSLVSGDILDTTVAGRDSVDGHTPWKQRMGLGRSIIVPQQRINPQGPGCHLQEVGPMCLVRSKRCVLCILDQVIALRGERALNVWTSGRLVPRNEAVSHHQLAPAVGSAIPDTAATLITGIAIDGAKDHLRLGCSTTVENTAPSLFSHVIRDRTVDQPERPTIVGDATTSISQIPRDCAADEGQRCTRVVDAATTVVSPISRDRAVDEGQRPSLLIEDSATISEGGGR